MLKITFPNGIIVEGDVMSEVIALVQATSGVEQKQEHEPEEKFQIVSAGILKDGETFVENVLLAEGQTSFPHRYSNNSRSVLIGPREDYVFKIAKFICEAEGDRQHRFRTRDIYDLSDKKISIHSIGSGLQGLKLKHLIRHDPHNRKRWFIPERGWNLSYRVIQNGKFVIDTA